MIINKMIISLIRFKLRLKKGDYFQFTNQLNKDTFYYFDSDKLMKLYGRGKNKMSGVPLNFLLGDECVIVKCFEPK